MRRTSRFPSLLAFRLLVGASLLVPVSGPAADCDENGLEDAEEIARGEAADCNRNGVPDRCDLANGTSADRNANAVPDECEAPRFTFELLPEAAEPGEARTRFHVGESPVELRVWLHTFAAAPGAEGAQGWMFVLATRGCTPLWVTTDGTVGAEVSDEPPGLRDRGFEVTRIEDPDSLLDPIEAPADGAVQTAVVLSFQVPVTLPPSNSPHLVLRLGVESPAPANGEACVECAISYPDWFYLAGIEDDHVVTWRGQTVRTTRKAATVRFCEAAFHRGDTNGDGHLDITDALTIFSYLFLTGDDPDCLEAANADDDERVNIADGIFLLSHLFLGGRPPPTPGPPGGPCGLDPGGTSGNLGCLGHASCG